MACKAFEQYLDEFVIQGQRKIFGQDNPLSIEYSLTKLERPKAKEKVTEPLLIVQLLRKLMDYIVDYIAKFDDPFIVAASDIFVRSFMHSLSKLDTYCKKAAELLLSASVLNETHLFAKTALLIENMLEYFISLDSLVQIADRGNPKVVNKIDKLKTSEQEYTAAVFDVTKERVEVYFTDNGQQAITTAMLEADMLAASSEKRGRCSDRSIFTFNDSYYEVEKFLEKVGTLKTYS